MKWIAIVGSWRYVSEEIEEKIRSDVRNLLRDNNGIISGGALGVDYIAVDEALKHDLEGSNTKVILPTRLETYKNYFQLRVSEGKAKANQVIKLMEQFDTVRKRNPDSLIELSADRVYSKSFHARNTEVVKSSDEVRAYQINNSAGTQNTINTARLLNKPVALFSYKIQVP